MGRTRSWTGPGVRILAVLASLALVAAACGDDNGGADNTTTTAEQAEPTDPTIDFDVELDDALLEANAAAFAPEEPGATLQMEDVAGSDAGFVAVGYETEADADVPAAAAAWRSEDGWDWERIVDDTFDDAARIEAVVATDDGFVGVGSEGRSRDDAAVWRSDDGRDWERVEGNDDAFAGGNMLDVAVGADGLVAVGAVHVEHPDTDFAVHAAIWRSDDGEQWEAIPDSALPATADDVTGQTLWGVAAAADGYVAGGGTGGGEGAEGGVELWQSPDGTTWERVESDALDDSVLVDDVAASEDGYVAVGPSGEPGDSSQAVWFSADGHEWEQLDLDLDPDLALSGVDANGDGLFVAVGPLVPDYEPFEDEQEEPDEDPRLISEVWSSEDGRVWKLLPAEDEEEARGTMNGVEAFANGYIAVGTEEGSAQVWVDEVGIE